MSEESGAEEKPLITLEEAKSGRSTCTASGEKIPAGTWRVGIEAWRGGRQSMTWQKAEPFLRNCVVEECTKANSGTCKVTDHKFEKGEFRFIFSTGNTRKFLTLPAAKDLIQPIIDVADDFQPSEFKGVGELSDEGKAQLESAFGSLKNKTKKAKPNAKAPEVDEKDVPASKKRKSSGSAAKASPKAKAKGIKEEDKEAELIGDEVKVEHDFDQSSEEEVDPAELPADLKAENGAEEAAAMAAQKEESADDAKSVKEEEPIDDAATPAKKQEPKVQKSKASQQSPQNAFEQQRLARIAANKERLLKMGIVDDARAILPKNEPKPRTKPKGASTKKKAQIPTGPPRRSSRVRGEAADGKMVEHEGAGGRITTYLHMIDRANANAAKEREATPPPKERHSKEVIAFLPKEEEEDIYGTFLDILKSCKITEKNAKAEKGSTELHKVQMKEEDLAKLTNNGISHVQWLPSSNHMIVAAGDKSGNLGLWNVDHQDPDEGNDGVYQFTPHYSYISGMRWAQNEGPTPRLYTGSYDGSLRCLDVNQGEFALTISSEDAEFSAMDCTADGNVVVLGDSDGDLHIYDVRENSGSNRGKPTELHNKRINTLHFEPGAQNELLSSSSDNSLSIWDLRKLTGDVKSMKPIATEVHSKTCQSAYFAPDGSKRIVSLSRDDTVRIWQYSGNNITEQTSIHHYNNTGRWVIPFRATWSPSSDTIIVGNMKRSVDLYNTKGKLLGQLQSEYMTAIASRANAHPYHNALAACTSSGRVHIYR